MPSQLGRYDQGAAGAWTGLGSNLALTAVKIAVGLLARSQALLADGIHSGADTVGSVAVLIGLRFASRPADADHPYGHEKAESVAGLLVAILLFLAGIEVAVSSALALVRGDVQPPGAAALWVAAGSALAKEVLYRYGRSVGRRIGSRALLAGAADHRSDAFSSLGALVGIAGARLGYPPLDPIAGFLVSLFIVRWGWVLAVSGVRDLVDARADEGILERIRGRASLVPGVDRVESVRARRMGALVLVDLEIGVADSTPLGEADRIAHAVRDGLVAEVAEVKDVMVHVNPVPPGAAEPSGGVR